MAFVTVNAVAVWHDVRSRRIPNAVTAIGVGAGLVFSGLGGADAMMQGVLGAAVALLIGIILYVPGILGAGDGKLLAVEGAFLGFSRLGAVALATGVAGGILAVVAAVRAGRLRATLARTANAVIYLVTFGRFGALPGRSVEEGALNVPYGVAIAAGALGVWLEGIVR